MSVERNDAARPSGHGDARALGEGGTRPAGAICRSCRGSGQWEEFLPEEVECMSCEGAGVVTPRGAPQALPPAAWPSEAWDDEFDIDEAGAFEDLEWTDADASEAAR